MSVNICQSCGMEMGESDFGTNADGSACKDYCKYCYANGSFIKDQTLDEVIESCIPFMINDSDCTSEEQARALLWKQLPNLKRWKK